MLMKMNVYNRCSKCPLSNHCYSGLQNYSKKVVSTIPAIVYKRKCVRILHEVVNLLLTNVDVVEQKTGD